MICEASFGKKELAFKVDSRHGEQVCRMKESINAMLKEVEARRDEYSEYCRDTKHDAPADTVFSRQSRSENQPTQRAPLGFAPQDIQKGPFRETPEDIKIDIDGMI